MMARFVALVASFVASGPALAQNMNAEAALRFVTGKLFTFTCVDGSGGTLRVRGNLVCASLKGLSFEPCFNLTRTGDRSFRGSVNGMDMIAYCDFTSPKSVAGVGRRAR